MDAFRLGPLVLSAPRFYAFVGFAVLVIVAELVVRARARRAPSAPLEHAPDGATTGKVVKPSTAADSASWAWNTVFVVLLASRIGFVLEHLPIYAAAPLSIFAIWQGGFSPLWGVAAGALVVLASFRDGAAAARNALVPAVAALAVWLALPALLTPANTQAPVLPSVMLPTLEGTDLDLASLRGAPVVVNLWATWCPPCRRELPVLAQAARAHEEVRFVFADQGETHDVVDRYLGEGSALDRGSVVLDHHSRLSSDFSSVGLPTTLFFAADGRHVATHVGELSAAQLTDYLKRLTP